MIWCHKLSWQALSCCFFFSSRRRHTRFDCDWSSDVCSSDLAFHARRMRRAFEGSNRVVQVGVQSTSGKTLARARELATPDSLGTLTAIHTRSEERRVGKEWRSRASPYHQKKDMISQTTDRWT